MKRAILCYMIILLVLVSSNVLATDLTKWKYFSEITFDSWVEKYAKADITEEVYDAAKLDLSDIRIIDSNDQQVPYLLVRPRDSRPRQKYLPSIINRSIDDKKNSLVTLDFGKQIIKNHIEVETQGLSFRRVAKVEGSNDNVNFFTLVEQAFLFAIDNKDKYRSSNIDLPGNDYRYLRITVAPMADEEKSPVIKELRVFNCGKKFANRAIVEMIPVSNKEDGKKNLSIYEYDLKFRNLPISEIQLLIGDESFYRHVSIEGRNALTRKVKIRSEDNRERYREVEQGWQNVTSGTVYRYVSNEGKKYENTTLSISSGRGAYRYLKVTIRNYNDRPLKLKTASAKMVPHQVIFDAADNAKVSLYVGSESAGRAKYDIEHKLNRPLEAKATSARLGQLCENPSFGKAAEKAKPWTEKHKTLLLIIMAMVVIVLGVFILRSFKSINIDQV